MEFPSTNGNCKETCQNCLALLADSQLAFQRVEVKLRLADKVAHDKLAAALESHHQRTHQQENAFFDGAEKELSKQRTVVRCRFYNEDERALLTIKGQQILKDGIGTGTEVEEDTDPVFARTFLETPHNLYSLDSSILQNVLRQHNVKKLVFLGSFRNIRMDHTWEGHKLELDTTLYPWGTLYEVEVESEQPEHIRLKLETFLREHGVQFAYSTTTKFANFINRTLV